MRYKSSRYYQQQPDFFFSSVFLKVVPGLFFSGWPFVGLPWTFDLISLERVVNAFYTFTASLADVSKNFIPKDSARVLPY